MHMMDHDQYTPETGNPDINSTYKSYEGKVFSIVLIILIMLLQINLKYKRNNIYIL